MSLSWLTWLHVCPLPRFDVIWYYPAGKFTEVNPPTPDEATVRALAPLLSTLSAKALQILEPIFPDEPLTCIHFRGRHCLFFGNRLFQCLRERLAHLEHAEARVWPWPSLRLLPAV